MTLAARLSDDDPSVRAAVAVAFAQFLSTHAAAEAVIATPYAADVVAAIVASLEGASDVAAAAAFDALAAVGRLGEGTAIVLRTPAIGAAFDAISNYGAVLNALNFLIAISAHFEAKRAIVEAGRMADFADPLTSDDPNVRRAATRCLLLLFALQEAKEAAAPVVAALCLCLFDADEKVVVNAKLAARLAAEWPATREGLLAALGGAERAEMRAEIVGDLQRTLAAFRYRGVE
jgi:hypothetical protein